MEKQKTDESVKSGLQVEADNKPHTSTTGNNAVDEAKEVDADDAVHEQEIAEIAPDVSGEEQDEDELVHSIPESESVIEAENEIDPDDLVHKKDELLPDQ